MTSSASFSSSNSAGTGASEATATNAPAEREASSAQDEQEEHAVGLPFTLETALERRIAADPVWRAGVAWGRPRPGHHEGAVANHIADVLTNVEGEASTAEERGALRLVALIHDSLKYQVDAARPKVGPNHHATLARHFAERYIPDATLLDLIELHDEAYHSWRAGAIFGNWAAAEARARALLARLGDAWPLYLHFYRADNNTPSKHREPVRWFEDFLRAQGLDVPPAMDAASEDTDAGTGR